MTILSLGDLATSHQQRLQSTRIRTDLARLTNELASGKVDDLRAATGGHLGTLSSLTHQLGALEAYTTAGKEAALFASTLQSALGTVQDSASDLAPLLLEAADTGHAPWLSATAADARAQFRTVVSTLNAHAAGRSLLGGAATGGPPLADAETMLADLAVAVSAETTAADVVTVVEDWFDGTGGGFETIGYLGSDSTLAPFRIGKHETVDLDVTAADQEFRDLLKGYAMAALVDAGALAASPDEQATLMREAGTRMFTANGALTETRGRLGSAEAAIDTAQARNASETGALELARGEIVAADPYATAVELEATQLQLEALYTITARLSRLNLTEFLR